jgi:putative transposase
VKFAFIAEQKVAFSIVMMCRVLDVSTSGYHAWNGRPVAAHAHREGELDGRVRAAHAASKGRYGSPRVHAELRANGERRKRRRFQSTTDSRHAFPIAPNVLERDFTATEPNQAWVTDITFIWTHEGWLYLAAILDLFSRRVVGWATSTNVDRHLALSALENALRTRRPSQGLVHHSDRGSTYASGDYRRALDAHEIECSMSRKGDCWDNAVAESFFASMKREVEEIDRFESRAQATLTIGDYIDKFYNVQRRHSTIGYKSPVEFELMYYTRSKAA